MKILRISLFIALFIAGFTVRLYKINSPIADWHSHRQSDTAAVTRLYIENGIDLLHPRYYDISDVQSGHDNPHGWRMVEFPIYNLISVISYRSLHAVSSYFTVEVTSRIVSIVFSLLSALLIYLICYRHTKKFLPSLFSLSAFLFLPFSVYYSRAILPEPATITFILLTIFLFPRYMILSSLSFAIALLLKPFAALILFPYLLIFGFLHLRRQINLKTLATFFLFSIISLTPLLLWRLWITHFPEGIPVSAWLFNQGGIRFRPAWFRWLFYERISLLILGSYGIIPLFLGFAYRRHRTQLLLVSLFLGVVLYFSIIARGNIQHDYYQNLALPFLSLGLGCGFYYLLNYVFKSRLLSIPITITISVFSLAFSWYQIAGYYQINNPNIIAAGQKANLILPPEALVVAPYTGDTAFLYQTHHFGWPTEVYDVEKYTTNNLVYLVSVNFDTYTNTMAAKYPTVYKDNNFIILDLNHEIKK